MMTQNAEAAVPAQPQIAADSKNWATLSHLSALVVFLGIPSFVGPLGAWLVKKDDVYAEFHAKEALNFNISFLIYAIAAAVSILLLIGLLLLPIVLVTWLVLVIRGSVKASAGEWYRYPFTLRFVS